MKRLYTKQYASSRLYTSLALPIWFIALTILLSSAQWSWGQTATPTPTITGTVTPTQTPGPELRTGAVQAMTSGGLCLEASDGSVSQVVGDSGTRDVLNYGNQTWFSDTSKASIYVKPNYGGCGVPFLGIGVADPYGYNGVRVYMPSTPGTGAIGLLFDVTQANPSYNTGVQGNAANGLANTIGVYGAASGSTGGGYVAGVRAANSNTAAVTKYGLLAHSTGANGTNIGAKITGSGGTTNWDLYTDGTQSHIAGALELTDSAQRVSVNTTNNTVCFGNSSTSDNSTIDCDDGTISTNSKLNYGTGSALTVSSNAITVSKTRHTVTAASATALNTINGYVSGDVLILCGTSAGIAVTVTDGAGNIQCGTNVVLDSANDYICLLYDGSNWQKQYSSVDN